MRDGLSLEDLGRSFSWIDLRSYIRYSPAGSALAFVNENPPVDPSTVPTASDLSSVSDRMRAARELAAGQKTTATRSTHAAREHDE